MVRLGGQGMEKKNRNLGQYTPAASDVQDIHALQHAAQILRTRSSVIIGTELVLFVASHLEHLFADETHPVRVHLVEEGKFAALVPPQRG